MINNKLVVKYSSFNNKRGSSKEVLKELFNKYYSKKYQSIIDTAAVASALSFEIISNKTNPLAEKAFKMTNPNFNAENYDSLQPNQVSGILASAKGKYFELLIANKLNNGEMVGNISLPHGAKAELADSITQKGWDINIINDEEQVIEYYQIKATDSLSYVKSALEKLDDIKILATNEIVSESDSIINTGIDNDALNEEIKNLIDSKTSSFVDNLVNGFNPILPLCLIAISQGYKIVVSKNKKNQIINETLMRSERSLILSAYSALYYASGLGWLGIPLTFGTGIIYDRLKRVKSIIKTFDKIITELYFLEYSQKARA